MTDALQTANQNKDMITEALRNMGLAQAASNDKWGRVKINGTTLDLDGNIFIGTNEENTLYGRLLDVPLEYHGMWIEAADASILGRPEAAESFCKSYYHITEQGGKHAEDGTSCETCPAKPYIKRENSPLDGGKKCSWRGDLVMRWVDKLGNQQDDRDWTCSLATTGMIELKGTGKAPEAGFVSDENWMRRLAKFGVHAFPDDDPAIAIAKIGAALKAGRVITSFKVVMKTGGPRQFPVIVMEPVNVILEDTAEAIPAESSATDAAEASAADESLDNLPF